MPPCDGGTDGNHKDAETEDTVMNDHDAMLAIQEQLDGVEWSTETLESIAEILTSAGYEVRDLDAMLYE